MNQTPKSVKCIKCGNDNETGLNFCVNCGSRLSKPCVKCGYLVQPDSRFCPGCGELTGAGRFGKYQHIVENTQHKIKCIKCNYVNSSGRRFCTHCGTKLVITCPACGHSNVFPSGYCPDCGNIMDTDK